MSIMLHLELLRRQGYTWVFGTQPHTNIPNMSGNKFTQIDLNPKIEELVRMVWYTAWLYYTVWLCYAVSCIVRNDCVASSFPPGDSFPIFVTFKPCAHVRTLVVFWSVSEFLHWRTYETPHCTDNDIFGDESGMSGTLGRVNKFDGDKDDWQQYVEWLEHFFVANGIDGPEKKRAVFLSVIGSSTYKTLRNLLSPNKPSEQSYADLVEMLCKHDKDDWQQYVERLEHFFVANGIDGLEKKRAVLLSVISSSTYKTLQNLLSPNKPGEQLYADLVETLCKHYKPAPSEIVKRFRFNSRVRRQGESVAAFMAKLRAPAEFCNFGATLEALLRDQDSLRYKRQHHPTAATLGVQVGLRQGRQDCAQHGNRYAEYKDCEGQIRRPRVWGRRFRTASSAHDQRYSLQVWQVCT